jgi:hypothetical protein
MNDVRVAIKPIDIIMREEIPAEINEKKIRQKETESHFVKFIYFYIHTFFFIVAH